MGNKLRNLFSKDDVHYTVRLSFQDENANRKFLEALNRVYIDGAAERVSGVASVETKIVSGDNNLPLTRHDQCSDFLVEPSKKTETFDVHTDYGDEKLSINYYMVKDGFVLETLQNEITELYLRIRPEENKVDFRYQVHVAEAWNVESVYRDVQRKTDFLRQAFLIDEGEGGMAESAERIRHITDNLSHLANRFRMLWELEKLTRLHFEPGKYLEDTEKGDLEEVYLLLVKKKALRLNAKLNSTDSTGITMKSLEERDILGGEINLTFSGKSVYSVCGQEITVYTANLLQNAVVVDVKPEEDGKTRILYGDKDSNPMYISFRGFLSEEEAQKEVDTIMSHKSEYISAQTWMEVLTGNGD